eukprot:TRINITY_DN6929_c0_g1_i1.p1 TRINITY_DN6929_c0_g1~~TRINITY_DN6929_c0_g1_i1.p1  ORF type:complete len:113 (-),score=9.13 TRINITY_DN6929_c0_g1_i1:86-424(-)
MSWKQLKMTCPGYFQGRGCIGEYTWICKSHGETLYINVKGIIEDHSGRCTGLAFTWSFRCHNHPGEYLSFPSGRNGRKDLRNCIREFILSLKEDGEFKFSDELSDTIDKMNW